MIAAAALLTCPDPAGPALFRLADLPKSAWKFIAEPPPGYNYQAMVSIAGRKTIALLDIGAAMSVVSEDTIVSVLNHALAAGLTAQSEAWPVASLEWWGSDSTASSVSKDAPFYILGVVGLRITFHGLAGKEATQVVRLRILRSRCSDWRGLILGGPALDSPPLGLGLRTTIASH